MISITNHKYDQLRSNARQVARSWRTEFSPTAHTQLLTELCREVGSDLSRQVLDALASSDYDRLISLSTSDPSDYMFSSNYLDDAQIIALIKKYPYWNVNADPKLEAMKTFIACEVKCKETNDNIWDGCLHDTPAAAAIFAMAQRKISQILDLAPEPSELAFKFGPGASFSVKNNTTALDKLESDVDVTPNCYGLAKEFLQSCPGFHDNDGVPPKLHVIHGDRLAFVPKTALTDRPIGINCLMNSVIQKGIGDAIRERLKPVINLRYAQDKHRQLALRSSQDGLLATIDLRSASDTLSYALVQDLLPPSWFDLMDRARSRFYMIENKWYDYHKFSAMGNGYTFELETLIFYAIASSCCDFMEDKGVVSVYGDDIIVPTQCASLVIEMLSKAGFATNSEKSFVSGPFRESCGGDYFNGYDVRPFYLKDRLCYRTAFLMHNQFIRKGFNFRFPKTFRLLRKLIGNTALKLFSGYSDKGDGHIYDPRLPASSYFTISSRIVGRKKSATQSHFSIAYGLYNIQFRSDYVVRKDYLGALSRPEPEFFTRHRRVRDQLRVHRHV